MRASFFSEACFSQRAFAPWSLIISASKVLFRPFLAFMIRLRVSKNLYFLIKYNTIDDLSNPMEKIYSVTPCLGFLPRGLFSLTGGGDRPGMNGVIRAVAKRAIYEKGMRRTPIYRSDTLVSYLQNTVFFSIKYNVYPISGPDNFW